MDQPVKSSKMWTKDSGICPFLTVRKIATARMVCGEMLWLLFQACLSPSSHSYNLFFSTVVPKNQMQLFLLTAFKSLKHHFTEQDRCIYTVITKILIETSPEPQFFSSLFSTYILQRTRDGLYGVNLNSLIFSLVQCQHIVWRLWLSFKHVILTRLSNPLEERVDHHGKMVKFRVPDRVL